MMEKQLILNRILFHVKKWAVEFRKQARLLADDDNLLYLRTMPDPLIDLIQVGVEIEELSPISNAETWEHLHRIDSTINSRMTQIDAMRHTATDSQKSESGIDLLKNIRNYLVSKINEGISLNNEHTSSIEGGRFPIYELEAVQEKMHLLDRSFSDQYRLAFDEAQKKTNELFQKYEDAIKNVENQDFQIRKLLGQLSTEELAGEHGSTSRKNFRDANLFLGAAFFLMLFPASLLSWTIYDAHAHDISTISLISRFSATIFLSVPITYLLRESGRFRNVGNRYQQTAVDLKALDPYLASLQPEFQQQTRANLANKMFFSYAEEKNSDHAVANMQELALKTFEIAAKSK